MGFQLTRSRGAWPAYSHLPDHNTGISTHTLTWSVTNGFKNKAVGLEHFNSHAHVERDDADETKFQEIVNFNSHAHVERDTFRQKQKISN